MVLLQCPWHDSVTIISTIYCYLRILTTRPWRDAKDRRPYGGLKRAWPTTALCTIYSSTTCTEFSVQSTAIATQACNAWFTLSQPEIDNVQHCCVRECKGANVDAVRPARIALQWSRRIRTWAVTSLAVTLRLSAKMAQVEEAGLWYTRDVLTLTRTPDPNRSTAISC